MGKSPPNRGFFARHLAILTISLTAAPNSALAAPMSSEGVSSMIDRTLRAGSEQSPQFIPWDPRPDLNYLLPIGFHDFDNTGKPVVGKPQYPDSLFVMHHIKRVKTTEMLNLSKEGLHVPHSLKRSH